MDALQMAKTLGPRGFYPETKPLLKQQKRRENLNHHEENKYHSGR